MMEGRRRLLASAYSNLFDMATQVTKSGFSVSGNTYTTNLTYLGGSSGQCLTNGITLKAGAYRLSFDMKITSGSDMRPFVAIWNNTTSSNIIVPKIDPTLITNVYRNFSFTFTLLAEANISFRAHAYGSAGQTQTSTVTNVQLILER